MQVLAIQDEAPVTTNNHSELADQSKALNQPVSADSEDEQFNTRNVIEATGEATREEMGNMPKNQGKMIMKRA